MPKTIDCSTYSDEQLVTLSSKDQVYFECLIERYEEKMVRYINRISRLSSEDSEDLIQEIFISVYKNLNSFDSELKFSSWIYRIAHNHVISFWRKNKSRPQIIDTDEDTDLFATIASDEDLASQIEQKINVDQVKEAIYKLDPKYREVLILRYFEDKDYNDISDILKKPKGTVATLINRAKKKLVKIIKKPI